MNTSSSLWRPLAREAMDNLFHQKRRTILALLGIVVGSAAIVTLLTIAHIAQKEAMTRFDRVGLESLKFSVEANTGAWLDTSTVARALASHPSVSGGVALATGNGGLRAGGISHPVSVAAIAADDLAGLAPAIAQGRSLTALDDCQPVALVGAARAEQFGLVPGDTLFIDGMGLGLVGIFAKDQPQALGPVQFDQSVIVPLACARRLLGQDGVNQVLVHLHPDTDLDIAAQTLMPTLLSGSRTKLAVQDAREFMRAMKHQIAVMSGVMLAVGSVSLLVGGIGVMNVMLMAVMERRKEIGLRAALGAAPRDIVFIFMMEASVLSLGGGILGAALGLGLTALASLFLPFGFAFSPMVVLAGAGVSLGVGMVFGLHPAVSASRILPVEALRAD